MGCTTELTDELAEKLLDLGKKIGRILEKKRRLETLKKLKQDYSKAGLRPDDICNLACAALVATIRGLKEASVFGAVSHEPEVQALKFVSEVESSEQSEENLKRLPLLEFVDAEQLVKKTPHGKAVGRSGTLSYCGLANIVSSVDRGYESAPKRDKRRSIATNTIKNTLADRKGDKLSKFHRDQTILERSAAARPLGGSSSVICVPDGPIQEWVSCELWLPKEFVFSHSKAKFSSHVFGAVLRTANVTEAGAAEDNGCFQDIMNICSTALVTCWQKDLRKKARKQVVAELEAKIPDLRDLDVPDLIGYVLDVLGRVAPGVSMYLKCICNLN